MATSGSFSSSFGSNSGYKIVLEWKRNSVDISNNKSNVTVTAYLQSTGSDYTIISSATKNGSMAINGTSYSFTFSASLSGGQKKQIYTKTVDIGHNADGTKSFSMSVSAGIQITFGSGYVASVSTSGTGTLDTIPRSSSFTLSTTNATLGSTSVTVTISRASNSFTHKVFVQFGSNRTDYSTNATTSCSFTPAISLASIIPNATTGTATVFVETYNGSTKIGIASKTITYTVPSSAVPTISSLSAAVVADGAATSYGYVKGKSKCQLTVNGAAGSYGSTIKSYKITGNGGTWTSSSATTGPLNTPGTITFTATATDSRGRTSASKTVSITVQDYANPNISSFSAFRCNSSGYATDSGTYVKVSASYSYTSLSSKNSVSTKVEYKAVSASSWTNAGTISSGSSVTIGGGGISTSSGYSVRLTVSDKFVSVTKSVAINPAFVTMDFRAGGKGVAIGKLSASDDFEVQMYTKFYNGVKAYSTPYDMDVALDFTQSGSTGNGQARIRVGGSGAGAANGLKIQGPGDAELFYVDNTGTTYTKGSRPVSNNANDLGSSAQRWRTLYVVNAINTSDEKYKENIQYLSVVPNAKNSRSISSGVTEEDIYNFYKNDLKLAQYNYVGQDNIEYGFIAQDLVNSEAGKSMLIDSEEGYMYSIGSYISTVAGALHYEINLRDRQIEELTRRIEELEKFLNDNK